MAETDLAEFILQVADEQPSHIIAPALHYSRERITALFKRKFTTDLPLDTGEELTKFAREKLREQFIAADAGISGANLIAADSGSLMLVESEGNIRMTMTLPSAAHRDCRHRKGRALAHRLRHVSRTAAGQRHGTAADVLRQHSASALAGAAVCRAGRDRQAARVPPGADR